MKTGPRVLLGMLLAVIGTSTAHACTLCHTPVALEVRGHVLGPAFAQHLLAIATPLPLLLALVAAAGMERPARKVAR